MTTAPDHESEIAMRVGGVVVDPRTQVPVVVLRGIAEPRLYLPIFIGGLEASAIATVLADMKLPRPMTHDLMVSMLQQLDCHVERVTVTKLFEGTFYAEITLVDSLETPMQVDARPSDSIALALRVGAPIFVAREVILEAGAMAEPDALDDDEDEGDGESAEDDALAEGDAPSDAAADVGGPPALVDGDEVRLEELDAEFFGKYKM